MERKVLIEKYNPNYIKRKVLIEKFIERNIFYVYVYLDTRKPGKYIYGDYSFDYEPFYVGKGTGDRSKSHLWETAGRNTNQYKFNKIQKIKKETGKNPIVILVKENLFEKESYELEIKYITTVGRYDLKKGPLTNHSDGGDGPKNLSQETRDKMSTSRMGKKHSEETKDKISNGNKHRKPKEEYIVKYGIEAYKSLILTKDEVNKKYILQYSLDGEFLKEHKGIDKIAKELEINCTAMCACLKGKCPTIAGYMWKYKENDNFPLKIEPVKTDKTYAPVLQYSTEGEFIKKWDSITQVSNILECSRAAIIYACQGKSKTSLKYVWRYYDGNEIKDNIDVSVIEYVFSKKKPVIQFDLEMKELNRFVSIKEASKHTSVVETSIKRVSEGFSKSAKGFIFKYVKDEINPLLQIKELG